MVDTALRHAGRAAAGSAAKTVVTGDWFGYYATLGDPASWRHRIGFAADLVTEDRDGACFLIDRPAAVRLAAELRGLWSVDGLIEVRWHGVVLVVDEPAGFPHPPGARRVWPILPGPDGRYAIDLGWAWHRTDPDTCDEVVGR